MNKIFLLSIIALVVIVAIVTGFLLLRESFENNNYHLNEQHPGGYSLPSHVEQGDLNLASLYRKIHLLERVARERVAQNNDGPGGNKGVPRERIVLERIARDSSRLAKNIRDLIAVHSQKPPLPTHYATNPMIGLPSQVGNVHWYAKNSG